MSSTSSSSKQNILRLTLTALMTALLCILGPWSIPLPFSPIPLSLGTLGIYFAAIVLGTKPALTCTLLYLLLGLSGLPVFSGFMSGPAKLFGPTGGYLLGYLFLALFCGLSIEKFTSKSLFRYLGMCLGTAICYLFGTLWLSFQLSLSFGEAIAIGVLPYLPGDVAKMLLALTLGNKIRRALLRARLLPTT